MGRLVPEVPPTIEDYRAQPPSPNHITGGSRPIQRVPGKPLVTLITIAWNRGHTIERAINSIVAQTYPSIEYVVVDGGSTDNTLDILRRHDGDITKWISEKDRGISDAFSKGISMASGEIIGFLNSDDQHLPEAVERSVETLLAHPESGFSFADCTFYDGSNPAFTIHGDPNYSALLDRTMPLVNHPTMFVRREVYEQFGLFRKHFRIAMDYDFLLRIHRGGVRGIHVPQVLTHMYMGGISSTHVVRAYRECLTVALDHRAPAIPAVAHFATSAVGHYGKRALLSVGAEGLMRRLEKWRYPTLDRNPSP